MAQAILALADQPGRLRAMSSKCRARALSFSYPKVARKLTQVYLDLLGR
jgi:hypothetical protein